MATKLRDPIIIYDDDFDGDYVLKASRRSKPPGSVLKNIAVVGLVILILLIGIGIFCRVVRRVFA